ncbi:MAG: hypothetical protein M1812_003691 [Candelaria pacifica]|nr:MAG: hypothetical protein M1812_003691 [Candelaria pacifica]
MASTVPVNPDTPITIKVALEAQNRKFKIPLRDLGASVFPYKLRQLLNVPITDEIIFERYSDSAGAFVTLDGNNPSVYKQLYRAAKAKLKLRIKATVISHGAHSETDTTPEAAPVCLEPHRYVPPMNSANADLIEAMCNAPETQDTPIPAPVAMPSPSDHFLYDYVRQSRDGPGTSPRPLYSNESSGSNSASPAEVAKPAKEEPAPEAPVPRSFSARESLFAEIASISEARQADHRIKEIPSSAYQFIGTSYSVYCNNCDVAIPNAHYHCSICDDGDFDLCQPCVEAGTLCGADGHWLIKRFVKNGKVINSTTETIGPKQATNVAVGKENSVPDAFNSATKLDESDEEEKTRTCNSCVEVFPDANFVTCTACDDYDLCIPCHVGMKHGHHPSHAFKSATMETSLDSLAHALCNPGRNMQHFAICDGCDKNIYGVRHKCLNCPDWDYCSTCIKSARHIHPGHLFVPIYEPIPHPKLGSTKHVGIYCDGPLCKGKGGRAYIVGDRYKCAVCHDTDFCANCEANPMNRHNRTHPLIKLKTSVKNVSVTTLGEKDSGEEMLAMGDFPTRRSASTETVPPVPSANAATQVQTVADLKPTEATNEVRTEEPVEEKRIKREATHTHGLAYREKPSTTDLHAHFVRDTVADGTKFRPAYRFEQIWTLRNPGPNAWPAGCSVRRTGGDDMLNVESNHPSSVSDVNNATETNVIGRSVEVGEEVEFRITLKTRDREGRSISYWRLKDAQGNAFGHRLWCDITVSKPEVPLFDHTRKAEETSKQTEVKSEQGIEESVMIFPKLDKESPRSSTHQSLAEAETQALTEHVDEEHGLLEEADGLDFEDDGTEDGFLTDEEYDILDASDEEFMIEAEKATKK